MGPGDFGQKQAHDAGQRVAQLHCCAVIPGKKLWKPLTSLRTVPYSSARKNGSISACFWAWEAKCKDELAWTGVSSSQVRRRLQGVSGAYTLFRDVVTFPSPTCWVCWCCVCCCCSCCCGCFCGRCCGTLLAATETRLWTADQTASLDKYSASSERRFTHARISSPSASFVICHVLGGRL